MHEPTMHFGKYKGKRITQTPTPYLWWCLHNVQNLHDQLHDDITRHLGSVDPNGDFDLERLGDFEYAVGERVHWYRPRTNECGESLASEVHVMGGTVYRRKPVKVAVGADGTMAELHPIGVRTPLQPPYKPYDLKHDLVQAVVDSEIVPLDRRIEQAFGQWWTLWAEDIYKVNPSVHEVMWRCFCHLRARKPFTDWHANELYDWLVNSAGKGRAGCYSAPMYSVDEDGAELASIKIQRLEQELDAAMKRCELLLKERDSAFERASMARRQRDQLKYEAAQDLQQSPVLQAVKELREDTKNMGDRIETHDVGKHSGKISQTRKECLKSFELSLAALIRKFDP